MITTLFAIFGSYIISVILSVFLTKWENGRTEFIHDQISWYVAFIPFINLFVDIVICLFVIGAYIASFLEKIALNDIINNYIEWFETPKSKKD